MTANALDLTTVANCKAWLGITAVDSDDAIQRLVTGASEFIQQYLSRDVVVLTYTAERYHGPGGSQLVMRNYPIVSVTQIVVSDQTGTALATYGAADCWFDDRSIYLNNGNTFVSGKGNISVTYQAGFATIPYGLAQATIELVALRWKERDRIGHMSKTLAGETVAFMVKDFPPDVKTYLDQFKNVVPA